MRINFRQGIISKQSNFLQLNGSGNIDLVASNRPVTLTVAHKDTDYQFNEPVTITDAWKGVFDANTTYWLYWDFNLLTLERTFGSTTLQPITQSSEPTSGTDSSGEQILQPGRMWFDTVNFVNYVYQGTSFKPVLRVFAGIVTGGNTISTASINTNFTGTQIGVTTSTFAGRPIFDVSGNPVQKSNGTFFTTESSFFSSGTRIDTIRLESNSVRALSTESNIAKFTAVAWNGSGQIKSAVYNDTGNTVVGILLEDTALDQVGSVLVQGTVTNPDWNWTNIGQKLWIDNNGTLTDTDPHTSNVSANPQKKVPVARVLSSDTIIFEQGLGGVGPTGATGSISNLPAATTSDLGAVRLTAQPSNTQSPLAVSDNDSRLTNARPPTSHSHSAGDITLTPTGNVSSNDIQNAIGELDSEKVAKTGDSMSGFLTLSADPTNNLHATTKRYVDGLVSGLVWRDPISVLNMIADDMTSPPSSPVKGDTYLMPSGTTGAWSGYDPDDVISWDGSSWVNRGQITNLASEPRIGIAFDTLTTPSGSFNGRKNQIAIYDQMGDIQTFITPVKNDAVFVRSASDQFAFFQYAYDGTSWVQFGGLQAIDMLNDIGDVNATSPTDGQALIYDSSSGNWIPGAGGAETLDQLNDVSASAPSDDQVLQFNSSSGNWENVTADFGASTLDQLDDVSALSPNDNDILFFSQGGTQQNWIYDSGYDGVYAIASDSSGNVYITDDSSQSIRKVDSSGTEQWSLINLFTTTRGITVDNDGNVHASLASGGVTKYDPSNGSQISSFDPGNISLDLAVDSNNNIIVLIFNQVENYTQSGILNWSSPTFSNNTDRVAVDSDDNVYASANNEVRKLDATGSQIWVDDNIHTNAINDMDTDTSGNLYTASSDGIRKIDPDGNLIWSFSTPGVPAQGIGVDSNNLVYAGFDDQIVYILDSDGNSVTSYTQPTSEIRDIDVNSSDQVFIGLGVDHSVHSIDYQSPAWNIQQHTFNNVVDVNASPTQDNILRYNGSQWVESSVKVDNNGALYGTSLKQETVTGTSYTITAADSGKILRFTSSSNIAVNVPEQTTESLPEGFTTAFRQSGAGQIALVTEGSDNLNNIDGHNGSEGQHALISIVLEVAGSPNEWILDGRTASVSPPTPSYVYSSSSDGSTKKINANTSTEVWSYTTPSIDNMQCVAVDSNGYVYSGDFSDVVHKIDSDGNQVWTFTGHTGPVQAIAVDSNGYVYTGAGDNTVRKIDSNGNQVWSFTGHTDNISGISLDSNGNTYTAGFDATVRKIDSNGNQVWSFTGFTTFVNIYDVVVDNNNGYLFSCDNDADIRKYDLNGNQIISGSWPFSLDDFINANSVAVDNNGYVYCAFSDDTTRKIDSNGNQVWSFTGHTSAAEAVTVDNNGYVYSGESSGIVRKIDSSGNQVWTFTHAISITDLAFN